MKRILTVILSVLLVFTAAFAVACKDDSAKNGSVSVKYYAQASDMLPMLKQGQLNIGLLPEPAATQLTKMASDKTWYRLDVQELYDSESKSYPQAVMLVKESLLSAFPNLVLEMANSFATNIQWVKDNVSVAVNAVNTHLESGVTASLKATNITAEVVDNCKIYWQGANDAKDAVKDYIDDIIEIEETSAKAVSDDMFYNGQASGTFSADTVKVVAPDGAPALAIAKFINDGQNFNTGKAFFYNVVASGNIGKAVQQGTGDIVIIPVNAASKLYKANASDAYKLVSVVTHGNLYIMSTEKLDAVTALKDKTMGVIGQGLVPDLTLKAVLNKFNMSAKVAV